MRWFIRGEPSPGIGKPVEEQVALIRKEREIAGLRPRPDVAAPLPAGALSGCPPQKLRPLPNPRDFLSRWPPDGPDAISLADRVLPRSMTRPAFRLRVSTPFRVLGDIGRLASLLLQSRASLAAENVFLRKQLALYLERQVNRGARTMPLASR